MNLEFLDQTRTELLSWYGRTRPTFEMLKGVARHHGVEVVFHYDFDVPRFLWDLHGRPWVIAIPEQFGALARLWALAHEVGHMVLHDEPPLSKVQHAEQEDDANDWASEAMIPENEIYTLKLNKPVDFFNYLDNYQNPKPERLAWFIAFRRGEALSRRSRGRVC